MAKILNAITVIEQDDVINNIKRTQCLVVTIEAFEKEYHIITRDGLTYRSLADVETLINRINEDIEDGEEESDIESMNNLYLDALENGVFVGALTEEVISEIKVSILDLNKKFKYHEKTKRIYTAKGYIQV